MARTINHIERISDSFDELDKIDQVEILTEMYTRLDHAQAEQARLLMSFWDRHQEREAAKGSPVPPLMEREEVEAAGKLALSKPEGGTQ